MNNEEIENIIEANGGGENMIFGDYNRATGIENVQSHGGEGEGDSLWAVYKLSDNVFIKIYGYWVSHDGGYYEGWHRVEPLQQMITVYNKINT